MLTNIEDDVNEDDKSSLKCSETLESDNSSFLSDANSEGYTAKPKKERKSKVETK